MRRIARGLQISCHSCHLCHGGSGKGSMSMCERRMSITEEELQVTQVSYPKAYFTPLNLGEPMSFISVIDGVLNRNH